MSGASADAIVPCAMPLVLFLHERDVPYTLLANRAELYVIPKARGRGDLIPTGAGVYETGGEIFVGKRELYDSLTEADVHAELAHGAVDGETFAGLLEVARREA